MNQDLILFLEENGFAYLDEEEEFIKQIFSQKMNCKIDVAVFLPTESNSNSNSIYSSHINFYMEKEDATFLQIRLMSENFINNKLAKILEVIDSIIELMEKATINYLCFFDSFNDRIYENNIYSHAGYVIDLSKDEPKIERTKELRFKLCSLT